MKKGIKVVDQCLNLLIFLTFFLVTLYGIYGIWDTNHVNQLADSSQYQTYKPTSLHSESFEDLVKQNPEVFGWLTVEGTNIDYPLLQADNNSKYVNTDVYGEFSLSGSIFLDYKNKKDFTDMNNILYGHHMAKGKMFGQLGLFKDKKYFDKHKTGKLFFNGQWHKVEFFSFLSTDAYDDMIYDTLLQWDTDGQRYLEYIQKKSTNYRKISNGEKTFLTLSTCNSDSTNGRYILIGYIKK